MRLERISDKPILVPRKEVAWEQDAIFNTAAVDTGDKIHLLYRAVEHPGWKFGAHSARYDSCIGYAASEDGIHFERFENPVLSHGETKNGIKNYDPQDPRVTQIGDQFYMLYCDWDLRCTQICMAVSKDLIHWEPKGSVIPFDKFGFNKNAALFPKKVGGRYCMIHRPEPRECMESGGEFNWNTWSRSSEYLGGMRIAYSDDLIDWSYESCVMLPRENGWDNLKIGIAGPPMKTDKGWLTIYHGVDDQLTYRLGVALLDLNDPSKVIKRQTEPILEPELEWERIGDVPNVVFSCGNFLRGDTLWVYYGGADTVISLARADIREFLADV